MIKIHQLKPFPGAKKRPKRVGRGGVHGTYAGRGMKGQKARSGAKIRPGFAGGTTPLLRQLPKKRGFKSLKPKPIVLNVGKLSDYFKSGDKVDLKVLVEADLIRSTNVRLKILGEGEITKKLQIHAHSFSSRALEKIKKAGGKAIYIK